MQASFPWSATDGASARGEAGSIPSTHSGLRIFFVHLAGSLSARSLSVVVVCGLNLSVDRRAIEDIIIVIITDFPKRIESKQKRS